MNRTADLAEMVVMLHEINMELGEALKDTKIYERKCKENECIGRSEM